MGFAVHPTAYFLVCNADRSKEDFNKAMHFEEALVPYEWDSSWIANDLDWNLTLMNQREIPAPNESCKNCAYAEQYSQALHPHVAEEEEVEEVIYEAPKPRQVELEITDGMTEQQLAVKASLENADAESREFHKHDEYIEFVDVTGETTGDWGFRDYLKLFWAGVPTQRRMFKMKNPHYIGPKKED